ncbi:aldehyde dehydrogenase 5F1 [Striga asiatica]|uniref:Aldehyde dehydrogenase 5F1 n=1 Tax=Striga asiatica TaxID=4170 RepID=A0A5A7P1U2_STRAF|nr:aldehyde dehydrogenase 5F1 [Striga asiatica]
MERSEPTLVPEWLKNSGSTGGGSKSHTDDHAAARVSRNKSFVNNNGRDVRRSSSSERTTSSFFHRSSSSNSSGNFRSYSSFSRNHCDREWEKDTYVYRDQDKLAKGDYRYREFSDPLRNTSVGKFERDGLRRSQSMVSGKRGDTWPKRVVADSNDDTGKNTNGVATRGKPVGMVNKAAAFERDFPTLGAEERTVTPEVGRVPSPGLNAAIQSLSANSALIGGEKWTSALAEVPMLVGSNGVNSLPVQPATSSSASVASSSTNSLNMAEAVAQGSSRAQTTRVSVGTQRLEELVIKQSRQLIPVTPSLPKTLVSNSSDKQKSKVGPQQPVKGDVPKAPPTVSKLHVLKPARDKNSIITPVLKDNLSPTNRASDRKPVSTVLEKRPTSQAQSRNDFFNLMRKKSMESPSSPAVDSAVMENSSSSPVGPGAVLSPTFSDKNAEFVEEKVEMCNVDGKKYRSCDPIISEEEEAAFLRSLGWEENDEEGGLTDEEISSFYRDLTKYINSKPSLKILQGVQLKFMLPLDSQIKVTDEIADAKLES